MGQFLGDKPRGADFLCRPRGRDWGEERESRIYCVSHLMLSLRRERAAGLWFCLCPGAEPQEAHPSTQLSPTWGSSGPELPADVPGAEPRHVPTAWEWPVNLINRGGCVQQMHGALCAYRARGGPRPPCALNAATALFRRSRDISCPDVPPGAPGPARGSRVLPCPTG